MKYQVINGDCLYVLRTVKPVDCIFADPFDNIGLGYDTYKDRMPDHEYLKFLQDVLELCVLKSKVVWWSFNVKWTFAMGRIFENLIYQYAASPRKLVGKACQQVFTFGQHNKHDLGNNHRPLWRLMWDDAPLYPEQIKVPSWRQLNGDKRAAAGGRVPGDVFDFPRVTGNSKQRRDYHPTQLHEGLVERAIKLTTKEGDRVLDPFGGTGTTLRVCKQIKRRCTLIELDPMYCKKIAQEHGIKVKDARKLNPRPNAKAA
jgi:DNA modification methylase